MKKILYLALCISTLYSCAIEKIETDIEKLETNSELYQLLDNYLQALEETEANNEDEDQEPVCLEFVYPFNIYLYDENDEIADQKIISDNEHFISYLDQSKNENAVGFSYPISTTTEDGSEVNINNNQELKEALEACIEAQIIGYCQEILEECYWKVTTNTEDETYQDSLFDFYEDGTGVFYYNGNAYRTSWVSLYIEEQLFVNIHLEDDTDATEHWNFNWNAEIISETEINIYHEDKNYTINKVCNEPNECKYVEFTACETSENTANFIFEDYSDCILSFKEEAEKEYLSITYFENQEDAESNTNELNTLEYTNKVNPQIIFIRIENSETNSIDFQRIIIFAKTCEE